MPLVVKFDGSQDHQLEAIESVLGLFEDVPRWDGRGGAAPDLGSADRLFQEAVFANGFAVPDDDLRPILARNLGRVQTRVRAIADGTTQPVIPKGARSVVATGDALRDFSIEMETGTGKTYAYLRTAIELHRRFGIGKFVVVVPSIAIREGVLSALEMTREHFRELYGGHPFDSYVYDSRHPQRLRQFATSPNLQILVMNIAAFHRDTNVINREADGMNGRAPVEFIRAVRPVVIMDEPQKLGSALQLQAIDGLNPLFRLRYSATHRDHHHRLYRLSPADAYNMRLVKHIDVLSVEKPDDPNSTSVEVKKITASKNDVTATLLVNKTDGRKQVTIRQNDDLRDVTGRAAYAGWVVEEIVAATDDRAGWVEFQNGRVLVEGTGTGVDLDAWHRELIRCAVNEHFENELRLLHHAEVGTIGRIKPLTLFFIDKVANYAPEDSKFRQWFEEEYGLALRARRFRNLRDRMPPAAADVHRGYFAESRNGAKDTNEGKQNADDEDAYDLIMRDKARLMSLDEPVRFVFSHSALAEGWDNPNVFTICNLQQAKGEVKRRQQIGRGLRLPVMENGERCRVDEVNVVTVVAAEAFASFAGGLQKELEQESGEKFVVPVRDRRTRLQLAPKPGYELLEGFEPLWAAISRRTTFRVSYPSEDLVAEAVRRLSDPETSPPLVRPAFAVSRARVDIDRTKGVGGSQLAQAVREADMVIDYPDLVGEVAVEVPVSRSTVRRVIDESGRLAESTKNPAEFRRQVVGALRSALAATLATSKGVTYTPRYGTGDRWDAKLIVERMAEAYEDTLVDVTKSIYDRIPVDSDIERKFAVALDEHSDVVLFVKLPGWFKVDTPVGGYNPDWAIVRRTPDGTHLYLVRETKGSANLDDLFREHEVWKVTFARQHFGAIDVDYRVVATIGDLDSDVRARLLGVEVDRAPA